MGVAVKERTDSWQIAGLARRTVAAVACPHRLQRLPALVGLDLLVDQTREASDPLEEATVLLRRAQANAMLPSGDRSSAKRDVEAAFAILTRLETRPYLDTAEQLRAMVGRWAEVRRSVGEPDSDRLSLDQAKPLPHPFFFTFLHA